MRLSQVTPALILSTAAVLSVAAPARAGVLVPGQRGGGEDFVLNIDDPRFEGETLATRTTPFEVLTTDVDTGATIGVTGTLESSVVRESATGTLAFHYSVRGQERNATVDFEELRVGGFAAFDTDAYSNETSLTQARSNRSGDGDLIEFTGDESWGADFVVRTNATAFDEDGRAVIWAAFQTGEPASGFNHFPGFDTFQPAAAGPGPTPIPLPPALWAGLSTIGVFGAFRALRRRK